MSTSDVLKPCPFCGGRAYRKLFAEYRVKGRIMRVVCIKCSQCYARGAHYEIPSAEEEEAIIQKAERAWNERNE